MKNIVRNVVSEGLLEVHFDPRDNLVQRSQMEELARNIWANSRNSISVDLSEFLIGIVIIRKNLAILDGMSINIPAHQIEKFLRSFSK